MRIIINADDFGKSVEINDAIEVCIKRSLITSVTIMAGGDAFDDAVARIKKYPEISVGVHLHIDECKSLTRNEIFLENGLMDENGYFVKMAFRRNMLSQKLIRAIYYEWDAQIKAVKSRKLRISHFDSHHHIHTFPELKEILCRLLNDHQIMKIRLSYVKPFALYGRSENSIRQHREVDNNGKKSVFHSFIRRMERILWNRSMKKSYSTTDFFCPCLVFLQNKLWFENKYKFGTLELMCHPGHPDYNNEIVAMEKIDKYGCEIINYHQLNNMI